MRDGRYSQTERDEMRWDEMRCLQQQPSLVKIDRCATAVNQTLMSAVRGGRVGCI